MPTLVITNFNIVCATLGGFITLFGLVSYLIKERFYLSEACITFSPHALNWARPLEYAGTQHDIELITFFFSRLVLGVQLVIAGIQLPSRYVRTEWRSLAILLGPGMTMMWLSGSLLVWAMVPHLSFLHALAVAACVTPTDPVLSNSIVKGKFADKNIPKSLQKIIIAESGANDGLGYPFLFLALYIIRYNGRDGIPPVSHGIGLWFGEMWGYTIILSVIYGIAVGWVAKELLHYAEEKKFVDRESFLVFALTIALFIVGTCGMIGSDDVLACFVAGNAFTWDDWFRVETEDDSLQPTIDMLLNIVIFMWYGAVAPWAEFRTNDVIPIYRLIFLAILILLFRRLPMMMLVWRYLKEIEDWKQAVFVGFFGPIGVSAVFYIYVAIDFLEQVQVDGVVREDAARLQEVIRIVVWFLAISSIVVHGLTVPIGKVAFHMPRVLSRALSSENENSTSMNMGRLQNPATYLTKKRKGNRDPGEAPTPATFVLGQRGEDRNDEPSRPVHIIDTPQPGSGVQTPKEEKQIHDQSQNHLPPTPGDGLHEAEEGRHMNGSTHVPLSKSE